MKVAIKIVSLIIFILVMAMPFWAQSQTYPIYSASYTFNISVSNLNDNTDPPDISSKIDYVNKTTNLSDNSFELFSFKRNGQRFIMGYSLNGGQLFIERQYETNNLTGSTINGYYIYTLFNTKVRLKNGPNTLKFQVQDSLIWITTANNASLSEGNGIGEGILYVNNDMELFNTSNNSNSNTIFTIANVINPDYSAVFSFVNSPIPIVNPNSTTSTAEDFLYEEYNYGDSVFALPSQMGNGLNFNGTNNNVSINNVTTANFTLETYIKTSANSLTGTNAYQGNGLIWSDVAGNANDFTLAVLNNKISFFDGSKNGGITGNKIINDGLWHHIAVTRQASGSIFIYIDGVQDATTLAGTAVLTANPLIKIGGNTLDNRYFNGSMDEIRIWNTARSQADIQASMNQELIGTESGLVAYFNCNQGIACGNNAGINSLQDNSGHSVNGTLNNFILANNVSNWVPGFVPTFTANVCQGSQIQLNNIISGGTWTSASTGIAAVDPITGIVTGVNAGTSNITYTYSIGNSCSSVATIIVTVKALPVITAIFGINSICNVGGTTQLSNSTANGIWSSDSYGLVNINSVGLVTGIANGTASINYSISNADGCIAIATTTVSVYPKLVANFKVASIGSYDFSTTAYQPENVSGINEKVNYTWYYNNSVNSYSCSRLSLFDKNCSRSDGHSKNWYQNIAYAIYYSKKVGLKVNYSSGSCPVTYNTSGGGGQFHILDLPDINSSSSNICKGASLTLSSSQGANYIYIWSTDAAATKIIGTDTTTSAGNTVTIYPDTTATYYVTVLDNAGNSSTSVGLTVTVNNWPTNTKNTGNALNFNGVNNYVNIGSSSLFNITNAITVEAWVKVNAFTIGWQAIVTKGDNSWRLHRYGMNNVVGFSTNGLSNVDLGGTTNINDGKWHHIAGVFDGTTKYIYVDGKLDASVAVTGTLAISTYPVYIGENAQQAGVRYFNGSIDEVRIWNTARTQAQIQAALNKELTGSETGLIAYYNFNQGIANGTNTGIATLADKTNNLNNGTLINFGLSGTSSNWVAGTNFGTTPASTNQISLDGVDDYVSVSNNSKIPLGNNSYTLEAMVKPTVHSTNGIIGWGDWWNNNAVNALRLGDNNTIVNYWWANDLVVTSNNLADGAWHHIAATYDGTTRKIYVDGALLGQDNPTGHNVVNTSNLAIGRTFDSEYFNGNIDEVRIWNIARSQTQIQNNLNCELVTTDTVGLVAYYNCNQGIASGNNSNITSVADNSQYGNNGILTNFALFGNNSNWVSDNSVGTINAAICIGSNFQLNNAATGGTWSSSNTNVATIDNSTGVVTGISNGTANISYNVPGTTSCTSAPIVTAFTINAIATVTANQITKTSLCIGETVSIWNGVAGGTWSSSNPSVVDVSVYNSIKGLSAGTSIITYTLTNASGCTSTASTTITVSSLSMTSFNGAMGNKVAISNTGVIWQIGTDGYVYRWIGSWSQRYRGLSAISLAVDNNGIPWIIGSDGKIYYYFFNNNQWVSVSATTGYKKIASGNGKTIVIAADNSIYQINQTSGSNPVIGTLAIYIPQPTYSLSQIYNSSQYYPTDIAVSSNGTVWFLEQHKNMNYIDANNVRQIAGCNCSYGTRIACGQDGSVFITGTDSKIYQYDTPNNNWVQNIAFGAANNDFAVYQSYVLITVNNSQFYASSCFVPNITNAIKEPITIAGNSTYDAITTKSAIHIYPNPAHDKITVQLAAGMEKAVITIFDILGNTLTIDNSRGLLRDINISGKAKGTYMIRVTSKEGVNYTQKLIIQ